MGGGARCQVMLEPSARHLRWPHQYADRRLDVEGWKEEGTDGGGKGIDFWLVIIIGRLNVPTWFRGWQDERARQCRARAEPLCSSPTWVWTLEGGRSLLAVVREEQLGSSSLSAAPICQQGWAFGRMKELGGGINGGASRLVIIFRCSHSGCRRQSLAYLD